MSGLDRSAAFWLRAYPRRWRQQHAAEVTAVLTDLCPAGARRLGPRAAAELVRAGWAMRWRQRPPIGTYLRYRVLEHRPAPVYDGWRRDDLEGVLYPLRAAVVLTLALSPVFLALSFAVGWSADTIAVGLVLSLVLSVVRNARARGGLSEALEEAPPEIGPMGPYRRLDG